MKKDFKLLNIYNEILNESIDLLDINKLESSDISLRILINTVERFESEFTINSMRYNIFISPTDGHVPSIFFGNYDENNKLNLHKLIEKNYSIRVLSVIFSLIRFWVDKNKVNIFKFSVEGDLRIKLYSYFLNKHFNDFNLIKTKINSENNFISTLTWKKK